MFANVPHWCVLLLDASLKSLLLAAIALSLVVVFRIRNDHIRHRIWVLVLAGMLLMPLLVTIVPSISVPIGGAWLNDNGHVDRPFQSLARRNVEASRPVELLATSAASASTQLPSAVPLQDEAPVISAETRAESPSFTRVAASAADQGRHQSSADRPATRSLSWPWLVGIAYAGVTLFMLLRLCLGVVQSARLIRGSISILDRSQILDLDRARHPVRECSAIRVPLCAGFARSCALLPPEWQSWTEEKLDAVLRHEFAHIERRDCLVNFLAELNRCVYWFHPLAWGLARWLSELAERCCDDAVIARADDRSSYARHLLEIAASVARTHHRTFSTSAAMARSSDVSARIHAILDFERPLSMPVNWRKTILLYSAILALVVAAAMLRPAAIAQDRRPPGARPQTQPQQPQRQPDGAPMATAPDEKDFTIEGHCLYLDGQKPAPDIKVRLVAVLGPRIEIREIASTVSGADGKFRFTGLEPPREHHLKTLQYYLISNAEGKPSTFGTLIPREFGGTRVYITNETISIKGRVRNERGEPVAGAKVETNFFELTGHGFGPSAVTNDEGLFILSELPMFKFESEIVSTTVIVTHPDYPRMSFEVQPNDDALTFRLKDGCLVTGSVVDADSGDPLAGIPVTAVPYGVNTGEQVDTVTGSDGHFRLHVVEGNYNIHLEDDLNRVAKAAANLECRMGDHVDLPPMEAMSGGWLTGQVVDTSTGKPLVFTPEGKRIALGLFGPSRPAGNVVRPQILAEVDDNGRFKMRAYPGENFPYFYNVHGSRMAWDTRNQPPVVIQAGTETECAMEITPKLTPDQQMAAAHRIFESLPQDTQQRVDAIIAEFRKLNHTVDECEIWCLLMRELVDIGAPAVLPLCAELESTDEQRMMRRVAFALRAIGDPRAVPTLIRALPKTLQPPMSDYGLIVADAELTKFMQQHSLDGGRGDGQYFSFGRPVREVHAALVKLTGHNIDGSDIFGMHRRGDARASAAQQQRYHEVAQQWAQWWEANWQQFRVDDSFSKVKLPAFEPPKLNELPTGLELTPNAKVDGGSSGHILTPLADADRNSTQFLDLDTGAQLRWTQAIGADDDPEQTIESAKKWAAAKGADLMCVAMEDGQGKAAYVLTGIGLRAWEIDSFEAKNIENRVKEGRLPEGIPVEKFLAHYDESTREHVNQRGSSFLYLTRENGLGVITITDFITEARDITGQPAGLGQPGVGFFRGVKFDYRAIER